MSLALKELCFDCTDRILAVGSQKKKEMLLIKKMRSEILETTNLHIL